MKTNVKEQQNRKSLPDHMVGHFLVKEEYIKLYYSLSESELRERNMYKERVNHYHSTSRSKYISIGKRLLYIFFGASLAAISLQLFMVKNHVIDGGIVGVSIILSQISNIEIGLFLLLLNTPFLFLGYSYLGKRFITLSLFAVLILSFGSHLLEPYQALTDNPLLVIIFGGVFLGLGIGIVIRYGGSLDGTEILAILFSKRSFFTIGQIVLFINFFIFGCSIFIFGVKEAIFSLATFFIAYKTIDLTINK